MEIVRIQQKQKLRYHPYDHTENGLKSTVGESLEITWAVPLRIEIFSNKHPLAPAFKMGVARSNMGMTRAFISFWPLKFSSS